MYIAIEYFTDNQDNSYAYDVGDEYPRKGYSPTAERINELASSENIRKRPVIGKLSKKDEKRIKETQNEAE